MNKKYLLEEFLKLISSKSVVNEIDNIFGYAGLTKDVKVEKYNSVRKNLAWQYLSNLDFNNEQDFQKFLSVIEYYLHMWKRSNSLIDKTELTKLKESVENSGYSYNEKTGRFTAVNNKINLNRTKELAKINQVDYVTNECERIEKLAENDPEDAITSAKSMVESTLKYILSEEDVEFKPSDRLRDLYKKTSNIMNLSPGAHKEAMFNKIMNGMLNIITGLDEIRNEYGDAHGKSHKNYKPDFRHALLTINAARTITEFLLESYKAKVKK